MLTLVDKEAIRQPGQGVRPQRCGLFVEAYLLLSAAGMLCTPGLTFLGREAGAFRNLQTGLAPLLFVLLAITGGLRQPLEGIIVRRRPIVLFAAAATAWLLAQQLSQYLAFYTNATDFSIFDWMLYNTNHGRFMYSPIYGLNHLGVHQTWILLAFVPLHRLFESHYLLLLAGAIVAAGGMLPLWRLARHFTNNNCIAALLCAGYITSPWVAQLVDGGFRPEVFFPVVGLTLVWGWLTEQPRIWIPALLLFVAIKEDAPTYAGGLAFSALVFEPRRRGAALFIIGLCALVFFLDLAVARPIFLQSTGSAEPGYVQHWGRYGASTGEIIRNVALSPLQVARDVLTSQWYRLFAPVLLLPLLSKRAFVAMLPIFVVFGTSANLRSYAGYTIAAMLPFFFWGWLETLSRISKLRMAPALSLFTLLLFPLVGGAYVHIERPAFEALAAWPEVVGRIQNLKGPVCAQLSIFPHLPYSLDARELAPGCVEGPDAVGVMNARFDPFPFDDNKLRQVIADAMKSGGERLRGEFVLVRWTMDLRQRGRTRVAGMMVERHND